MIFTTSQKIVASRYGSSAEIRIWNFRSPRGSKNLAVLDWPILKNIFQYIGIIIPLLITLLSNGLVYFLTVIETEIESSTLKRLGKRWKVIPEFEYAKVVLTGPLALILFSYILKALSIPSYFIVLNTLIAVFAILPLPKLNGGELVMNSRPLFGFGFSFIIASALLMNLAVSPLTLLGLAVIIALLAGILFYYYVFKK